ncbi:MAG: copper resistance protein NlpE [Neisseria sp.]|nr:copper resistance protein NlpE [Neisseria sp.]
MNKTSVFSVLLMAAALTACGGQTSEPAAPPAASAPAAVASEAAASAEAAVADMHNAENALDWPGKYEGVLPCASCEGIKTELALKEDGTYVLTEDYQGGKEALKETLEGKFTWGADGTTVTLDEKADGRQYFVSEGYLAQLDADGKVIEGEMEKNYQLNKTVQ